MGRHRQILGWLVAVVITCMPLQKACARGLDEEKVAKVKTAYLLNFIRFTMWSDDAFADSNSPLVILVLGPDHLGEILDETLKKQKFGTRPVKIRRLTWPPKSDDDSPDPHVKMNTLDAIRSCHLLYVHHLDETGVRQVLSIVDGAAVLTVSDLPGFARLGGMLGLVIRNKRIVFEANPQALASTRVMVSSKVLKLAHLVETKSEVASP